jgi:V/A-type H+-transporting ATPase subunit E
MSGLDTMIKTIQDEAGAEARALIARAGEDAARILEDAKTASDLACGQIIEQSRKQAEVIRQKAEASAEMERRRALLAKKQTLLDQTVRSAREAILAMPETEYFDFLIRLAAENAEPGAGVIFLSKRDLERLPNGFHGALNRALPDGASLDIASNAQPIDGGLLIKYGDIDRNCALSAIFDENRERILDAAQSALFQ